MFKSSLVMTVMAVLPMTRCLGPRNGTVCTEVYVYGVNATVTNAQTGAAIGNATLTLKDGDYTEVMQAFPSGGYAGAGERPGTYTLTVEANGFETKTIENIVVTSDPCHVIQVTVQVALEPK